MDARWPGGPRPVDDAEDYGTVDRAPQAEQASARWAATVAPVVAEAAARHRCPEISWGIVAGGRLLAHGGAPHRRFRIASMTKSFTAAAVLALRDEGSLDLDAPIGRLVPALASVGTPAGSAPIRLRDLLSMSSGLATDDPWADRHLDIDAPSLMSLVAGGARVARRAGEGFEYSNLGYGLIGRVVEHVTGRSVQAHVDDRLLRPLGMSATGWVPPDDRSDWACPHRVVDGVAVEDAPPLGDGAIAPMGGLWSNVTDLTRWVTWLDEAWAAPTRPSQDAEVVLRASSRREMQRMHTYIGVNELAERRCPAGYGFGLTLRDDPDLGMLIAHSGGLPGYGSNMRWIAGRGVGAIALANVTYAPMADLTVRMLVALHAAGLLPPTPGEENGELRRVAERLVAVLTDWRDDAADAVFADNVPLDEPYDRRAAAARPLGSRGPLTIAEVHATTRAAATATVHATDGSRWRLSFSLAPLTDAKVQEYTLAPLD